MPEPKGPLDQFVKDKNTDNNGHLPHLDTDIESEQRDKKFTLLTEEHTQVIAEAQPVDKPENGCKQVGPKHAAPRGILSANDIEHRRDQNSDRDEKFDPIFIHRYQPGGGQKKRKAVTYGKGRNKNEHLHRFKQAVNAHEGQDEKHVIIPFKISDVVQAQLKKDGKSFQNNFFQKSAFVRRAARASHRVFTKGRLIRAEAPFLRL